MKRVPTVNSRPYTRYGVITTFTLIIFQMVFPYGETCPSDYDVFTVRAIGIFTFMPGYIAYVGEVQTGIKGNFSRQFQGLYRSRGEIFHLVGWVKSGKMNRHIIPQIFPDPDTHLLKFFFAVIERWYYQHNNFKPNPNLL